MEVKTLWPGAAKDSGLARLMGLACETDAYDPMEKPCWNTVRSLELQRSTL